MKRNLLLLLSLLLSVMLANADEQKRVKLDEGHQREQIHTSWCNVFVTKVDADDDGNTKVSVEIENLDESDVLILVGHTYRAYTEKDLKKLSPSIRFDRKFAGTKGRRNIDTYEDARDIIIIDPSEKHLLPEIYVKAGEMQQCRLPLYTARCKYRKYAANKALLLEKVVLELEIEADFRPDEEFVRLERESNVLIEEISSQTFCTNSRHRPSLDRQEAPYKERLSRIKSEIDSIVWSHNWHPSDRAFQRYNGVKQKLNAIDFSLQERDCGIAKNHKNTPARRHSCKYCRLSLQQIYHKIDDYYKQIYNSSNRKAARDAVEADVELLYRCCTDASCAAHSSWRTSEYKEKITDRYNRISNF